MFARVGQRGGNADQLRVVETGVWGSAQRGGNADELVGWSWSWGRTVFARVAHTRDSTVPAVDPHPLPHTPCGAADADQLPYYTGAVLYDSIAGDQSYVSTTRS